MTNLVEKLQLQYDEILLQFEPIGLKKIYSFTGIHEPEYEGKTKPQLITIINGTVDSLKEDEDKIELLNNIYFKLEKVLSKLPGRYAAINNDWSKRLSSTEDTGKPIFHNIDTDA